MDKKTLEQDMKKAYLIESIRQDVHTSEEYNIVDSELANFIRDNVSAIKDNSSLMFDLVKKIITPVAMIRELITYEFLHSVPKEDEIITDVNRMKGFALKEIKKYQGIIGGFHLEDLEWLVADTNSRFNLKGNQTAIYNTIEKDLCFDKKFKWFLKKFVSHMKKFVASDAGFDIKYKIIEDDENCLCWILFVFESVQELLFNEEENDGDEVHEEKDDEGDNV